MGKVTRKSFISVRGGFSDSTGIAPCNAQMQYDEFDDKTRILISNKLFILLEIFFDKQIINYKYRGYNKASSEFCKVLISNVFGERIDLSSGYDYVWTSVFEKINTVICEASYNEVLDIVWFSCNWLNDNYNDNNKIVYDVMNTLFEKEYVGYRFVNGKIVAITDKTEIDEIEQACTTSIKGCKSHLEKAVGFLSDREKKDYKNCIKESISAVEAMCQIITGDSSATLGTAIKKLKDNGLNIHSALESAFSKLYGYTSDEGGIRHCEGLFVSNVTFEEAKFMLVSCSAFVNYLIAEYGKANFNK
jgi:hypothetical protein